LPGFDDMPVKGFQSKAQIILICYIKRLTYNMELYFSQKIGIWVKDKIDIVKDEL